MNVVLGKTLIRTAGVVCMLAMASTQAACPGESAYASVKSIVINSVGSDANIYIEVDATAGSSVDVCGCRNGSDVLYLLRPEAPLSEGTKLQTALVMEAKALNKKISYYASGCYFGANSGYVGFTQISMEP